MLNSLQACRALAALLVVFYHTSHGIFRLEKYFGHKPFGPIFDFGYAGVDFFFVLSGFIMMHVHAGDIGQPRALGAYLWKRFTRIYPAYWVVLAAVLPIYFLAPSFGKGHERDLDAIFCSIFLFPHPDTHLVVGVAWTLVYEIFFYSLFAVLILHRRFGIALFIGWAACVFCYSQFENYPWTFLFGYLHVRFLAGMAVAFVLARCTLPAPRLVALVGTLIFVGAGMIDAYVEPLSAFEQILGYALGSSLALAGVVQAERSGLISPPRWLVYLGNASYAIYLVHFLALSVLAKITKSGHIDAYLPAGVLFGLFVLGAVGAGCLFHHLVEHPLHNLTKRYFRRERIDVRVAPAAESQVRQAA